MTGTLASLEEPRSSERLREEELEEARAIQSVMLPNQPLQTGSVTISHGFRPVAEVGGDFLDYFELTDGSVGVYLGDVSGKGLPAALYAALAVGTLRGVHKTGQAPSQVFTTLNRRLTLRGVPARHAALQYALYDPQSGLMRISSAGMPGPLVLSRAGCRMLELCGIPPGLLPDASYGEETLPLARGEALLFFTDGITDARNVEGEEFGAERLQRLCEELQGLPSSQILGEIFEKVSRFSCGCRQHDDMAAALFVRSR